MQVRLKADPTLFLIEHAATGDAQPISGCRRLNNGAMR
jgi:hypothetical protein